MGKDGDSDFIRRCKTYYGDLAGHIVSAELSGAYERFLARIGSNRIRGYCKLVASDGLAALAEAASWDVLTTLHGNARPHEDPAKGGCDLAVDVGGDRVLYEVTSLSEEAVTSICGPALSPADCGPRTIGMLTAKMRDVASSKAAQLAGSPHARVLIIAARHNTASTALGAMGAHELMTGGSAVAWNVAPGEITDSHNLATLRESVFFRERAGELQPCRQSISAIILMSIGDLSARLVGLLHPQPAVPWQVGLMPRAVPFLRVRDWPCVDGSFSLLWEWSGTALQSPNTTSACREVAYRGDSERLGGEGSPYA